MHDEIEAKSHLRRIMLMIMASAFMVWQVPLMDFFGEISGGNNRISALVSGVGFLTWAGLLIGLLITGRIATVRSDPRVAAALDDELVRSNRTKAFLAGYIAALVISAIVLALSLFQPVTGTDAAHIILVAAVVAPIYAFVVLERINA